MRNCCRHNDDDGRTGGAVQVQLHSSGRSREAIEEPEIRCTSLSFKQKPKSSGISHFKIYCPYCLERTTTTDIQEGRSKRRKKVSTLLSQLEIEWEKFRSRLGLAELEVKGLLTINVPTSKTNKQGRQAAIQPQGT